MRSLSERFRELLASFGGRLESLAYNSNPFAKWSLNPQEEQELFETTSKRVRSNFLIWVTSDGFSGLGISAPSERTLDRIDSDGRMLSMVSNKQYPDWIHGYLISSLIASLEPSAGPFLMLDLGTARGFSALTMGRALQGQGLPGLVISMDFLPHNRQMFWSSPVDINGKISRGQIWDRMNAPSNIVFLEGPISQSLRRLEVRSINLAFLDSQHSTEQVGFELSYIIARQTKGDLIVLDDFGPEFPGVSAAAKQYLSNYESYVFRQPKGKTVAIFRRTVS